MCLCDWLIDGVVKIKNNSVMSIGNEFLSSLPDDIDFKGSLFSASLFQKIKTIIG